MFFDRRNKYRVLERRRRDDAGNLVPCWHAQYQRPHDLKDQWWSIDSFAAKHEAINACRYHAEPETDPSITSLGRLP